MAPVQELQAIVDYTDAYVRPLILSALRSHIPSSTLRILDSPPTSLSTSTPSYDPLKPLLQWRDYESLDFEHALSPASPAPQLINAYVIRKALIRKHFLAHTAHSFTVKNPNSALARHFAPGEHFELDYAEFLDDALVEAFDLRAALDANETESATERQWWILKPGMSDRGQGIRLFSSLRELTAVFEAWEGDEPDEDDDGNGDGDGDGDDEDGDGLVTSHLRHFVAQPYIHPPLLVPQAPFANRKFHIRTYVVAAGALQVYVYDEMLALFASEAYVPPWEASGAGEAPNNGADDNAASEDAQLLQRMRNVHLSNTCVQSASGATKEASVFTLDNLPLTPEDLSAIKAQIRATTADLFRAALAQPVHFQAQARAFEIFGLDFLVSAEPTRVWLLEVNAFPDFAQTGDELGERVVGGLFGEVVRRVVGPGLGIDTGDGDGGKLLRVLDEETGLH